MGHGLVVEDDAALRRSLARALVRRMPTWVIETAASREEAMGKLTPDLEWMLIDMCLSPWRAGPDRDLDGLAVLLEARARGIVAPAIVMTGAEDVAEALNPCALGALRVLKKPFETRELLALVARASSGVASPPPPPVERPLEAFDEDNERCKLEHVRRVLEHKGWSRRGAAKMLKVDRRTIDRYVERLAEQGVLAPARASGDDER